MRRFGSAMGSPLVMINLRPFQKTFIKKVLSPEVKVAALSIGRANGKSTLAAHLLSRVLDPKDELFRPGTESVITGSSLIQCRIVYRVLRTMIGEKGLEHEYKFIDSAQRIAVRHTETDTRLVAHSGTGKTLFGLLNTPWVIVDEPGSLELAAGELLFSAIKTSLGKMDSPLKVVLIGHLAPFATRPGHWYYDLVNRGSRNSTFVMKFQGNRKRWDDWNASIRKANPLLPGNPELAAQLKEERKEARIDESKKAEFLSVQAQPSF